MPPVASDHKGGGASLAGRIAPPTIAFLVCGGNSINPTGLLEIKGAPGKISDTWQSLKKRKLEASYPISHLDPLFVIWETLVQ